MPEGTLRIHGRVQNSSDATADAVIVRVVLTGDAGEPIDSIEVPAIPPRLEGGSLGTFEAFFRNPGRKVSILIELRWMS
jgi:hypothetical protein